MNWQIQSTCGVIPKSQLGKWRLIIGSSINDGISKELCSLQYVSVYDILPKILELGQRTLMAKLYIESAYRIVPVNPDDRHFLGIHWKGINYMDSAVPFGMRSAPTIFNSGRWFGMDHEEAGNFTSGKITSMTFFLGPHHLTKMCSEHETGITDM